MSPSIAPQTTLQNQTAKCTLLAQQKAALATQTLHTTLNLIILANEITHLNNEIEKEKTLAYQMLAYKMEYNKLVFEQDLCLEEYMGKAFLSGGKVAEMERREAEGWEREERDRQFEWVGDMEGFLWAEGLWEGCVWGWRVEGLVMV